MSASNGSQGQVLYSIEAEQSVLGCMLQSPRAVSEVVDEAKLTSAMFYRPAHGIIFDSILRLMRADREIDHLTVRVDLQERGLLTEVGGQSYLFDIELTAPAISNAKYYADIVIDQFLARNLETAGKRIVEVVRNPDLESIDAKIAEANVILDGVKTEARQSNSAKLRDIAKTLMARIDLALTEGKAQYFPVKSGFSQLEARIGGFRKGSMYSFGGGPKVGKTSFATSLATGFAIQREEDAEDTATVRAKYSVLYFSVEIPSDEIGARMIACLSGVDTDIVLGKVLPTEEEYMRISDASEQYYAAKFEVIDETSISTARIDRLVAAKKRTRDGCDVAIVDYYQLISPAQRERGDTENTQLTRVSKELTAIGKKHDVVMVVIYQQSDKSIQSREDKRPRSTDIHGCSQLPKDCAAHCHLYRDTDGQNTNPKQGVSTEVVVHLTRYGGDRSITPYLVYQEAKTRYCQPKEEA